MQLWLMWILFALAWVNPNIKSVLKRNESLKEWVGDSWRGLVIGAVFSFFWIYFLMPTAIFTVAILNFLFTVFIVNLARVLKDIDNAEDLHGWTIVVSLILLIALAIMGGERYNAEDVAQIPNIKIAPTGSSTDRIPINYARLIPQQSADQWMADKTIGELGSKNQVGEAYARVENNSIAWYVAMEYDGIGWKAWKYEDVGTDGYVRVSAESPNEIPTRITGFRMKYIPSAVFGYNLHRLIYFEYPEYYQGKNVFQLDDKNRPIYVTVLMKPTIWRTAEIPIGIVISYPETGELKFHDLNNVPDYIQRTVDEELLEKYLFWWGEYKRGYWNSITPQEGVIEPSGEVSLDKKQTGEIQVNRGGSEVYYVMGYDGRPYFYSVMVAPGTTLSITGFIMADVRDINNITYYKTEGYLSDIAAAISIQQNEQVSKVMGYHVNQPIRYEFKGIPTYIAPVLGSNQEVKLFGIVNGRSNMNFVGEDFNEVLGRYENAISGKLIEAKESDKITEKVLTNITIKYSNNETQSISLPQGTIVTISN